MPAKAAASKARSACSRRWPALARAAAEPRTSLIPQTLEEMAGDAEGAALAARLATEGQAVLTREERRARQRSLDALGVPPFLAVARVRRCRACLHPVLSPHQCKLHDGDRLKVAVCRPASSPRS